MSPLVDSHSGKMALSMCTYVHYYSMRFCLASPEISSSPKAQSSTPSSAADVRHVLANVVVILSQPRYCLAKRRLQ